MFTSQGRLAYLHIHLVVAQHGVHVQHLPGYMSYQNVYPLHGSTNFYLNVACMHTFVHLYLYNPVHADQQYFP